MAVGRVNGGREGVEDYLEYGLKAGQEQTRDELDERIVLEGDLDILRKVIDGIDNTGEKYAHYTFSFKEPDVPLEKVIAAVGIIKKFVFAAFSPDELDFYAELQNPKIKNAIDKNTGELVERKPHIHIVIPKTNLLTGKREDPLGFVKNNIVFLDALQEYINIKLDLASPKDNPREGISHADIIARKKDDDTFKKGSFKAVLADMRERIASGEIENYDALKAHLATVGEVKITNAGKEKEYLGVKLAGKDKFVNLREQEFRKQFFDMPAAAQREYLGIHRESVHSVGIQKRTLAEYEKLLDDWHQVRAKEVRYLNSGSKLYKKYEKASPEEKQEILLYLEQRAKAPILKKEQQYESIDHRQSRGKRGTERDAGPEHAASERSADASQPGAGNRQPYFKTIGTEPPPAARRGLRDLSARPLARQPRGDQELLPRDVRGELVELGHGNVREGLRRADARVNPVTGRSSDSAVSQLLRDVQEAAVQRQAAKQADIQEIKLRLDGRRLLADLSRSHFLQLSDFEITKGTDGGDRIRHRKERLHYNVSDFLTKYMRLPWNEAQPYLQATYAKQIEQAPVQEGRQRPNADLWAAFQARRRATFQEDRNEADARKEEAWQTQKASENKRRAAIKDSFYKEKSAIWSNKTMGKAEKKAQISIIQMAKVQKEEALREVVKQERAAIRAEYQRKVSVEERYKIFLRQLAEQGNHRALLELRRQRDSEEDAATEVIRKAQRSLWIDSESKKDSGEVLQGEGMRYKIHRSGDVVYSRFGKDVLIDRGSQVDMLDTSEENIERGLRLSAQKWGGKMKLHGSAAFIDQAIRIAADRGMKITFNDPAQQRMMEKYQAEREKQRELEAAGRRFGQQQAAREAREAKAAKTAPAVSAPLAAKPVEVTKPAMQPQTPAAPQQTPQPEPDQAIEKGKAKTRIPAPGRSRAKRDEDLDR